MIIFRGKPKKVEGILLLCNFFHLETHPGSRPSLHRKRSTANRLSHGTPTAGTYSLYRRHRPTHLSTSCSFESLGGSYEDTVNPVISASSTTDFDYNELFIPRLSPYLEPDRYCTYLSSTSLRFILIQPSHLRLSLPSGFITSGFPIKTPYR